MHSSIDYSTQFYQKHPLRIIGNSAKNKNTRVTDVQNIALIGKTNFYSRFIPAACGRDIF